MIGNNGYIGRNPGDSTVRIARQVYQPTAAQTEFTFAAGYDPLYFDVYLNGAKLVRGIDYTAGNETSFSLITPCQAGDVVEAETLKAFNAAEATIGISSNGRVIGEANNINFIGAGNTFAQVGNTINVEIAGGAGGGGVGTAIRYPSNTPSPFSYIDATATVTENIVLDQNNAGESFTYVVVQEPRLIVQAGAAMTVGLGKTLVTDLYQLGNL
jgi:hypothetical protein|tara:strand:+ start:26 stop:664 length:639 start_codon:yes stop_codon:yes gene_type:complete